MNTSAIAFVLGYLDGLERTVQRSAREVAQRYPKMPSALIEIYLNGYNDAQSWNGKEWGDAWRVCKQIPLGMSVADAHNEARAMARDWC